MRSTLLLPPLVLALAGGCASKPEPEDSGVPDATFAITTPEPGDWTPAGESAVKGTATNVDSVTVGLAPAGAQVEAARSGDGWSGTVTLARGANVVEADAVDLRGDTQRRRNGVLAGDFANPDDRVAGGLAARVNQSGLDRIGAILAESITPEAITTAATAMNPVYSDSYGWGTINVAADIDSVDFGAPDIALEPSSGLLTLTATLPDLYVDAQAYGDVFGYGFDEDVSMSASSAVITATVAVDAQSGALTVTLTNATVDLKDFSYDTSLLPGDIESYLLVDTLRDALESTLVEKIQEQVPPLLTDTLAGLDPSFSTEVLGQPLDVAFGFASADIDNDGIALGLDVDVDMADPGLRSYPGYLTAPDATATLDTHADVSAGFSDNLLNVVLFKAWRAGLLDMRLSTDDGSLEPAMLLLLKADEGTITTSAALPPVLVQGDSGAPQLQVTELLVTIDTPGGELGEHIVVAVSLWVDVAVDIADGSLVLELGTPTIVMDVRESDWGASNEATTQLLEQALPIDVILMLLGDISFPLPSLYGITFASGDADRDESGYFTDATVYFG